MKVRVLRSIREIEPSVWDKLCDETVFSHGWFLALEESKAVDAHPRHLLLEQDGRAIGILPCFIQKSDPYYSLADRLFGPLAPIAKHLGLRVLPALLAYSPLAHRSKVFLADGVDHSTAIKALLDAMQALRKAEKLPACGWLFGTGNDQPQQALRAAGYRPSYLCPTALWLNTYLSLDMFLERIRRGNRHRYKMIRNELNRFKSSGIALSEEPLNALTDDQLAAMHATHYKRHNTAGRQLLTPEFFGALKRHLGERALLHVARRDGHVISYSIVLKDSARWHLFLSGEADSQAAHQNKLHFHINYYFPMQKAIDSGAIRLDYGMSAYTMKLERGCLLEPTQLWLQCEAPIQKTVMRLWLPVVGSWYKYKHRRARRHELESADSVTRGPFLQRAFNRLFEWRKFFLISLSTDKPLPEVTLAPSASIRPLAESEFERLRPTATRSRWQLFQRFQTAGYHCSWAWVNNTPAGYIWYTSGGRHIGDYLGTVPLKPDEGFIGYTYVWPQFRGIGLAQTLKEHARKQLASSGVRLLYSGVISGNAASLKSNARLGALPVGCWRYMRIGPWSWRWNAPAQAARLLNTLFARERQRVGLLPLRPSPVGDPFLAQRKPLIEPKKTAPGLGWLLQRGFRELIRYISERATTLELVVPLASLAPIALPAIAKTIRVRRLNPDQTTLLRPISSRRQYRFYSWLSAQGGECYVAEVSGRIVGYNWYLNKPYRSPFSRITFPLEPGEKFLVYSLTLRPWRGRGVDVALKNVVFEQFRQQEVPAIRTTVDDTNRPSLRGIARYHPSAVRAYHYRRFLGWRSVRVENINDSWRAPNSLTARRTHSYTVQHAKELSTHAPS